MDLSETDYIDLSDQMAEMLLNAGPEITFEWLISLLAQQRPELKSSNSKLVAYTGCSKALDWLEDNVSSPVTTHWGEGAALLGVPWERVKHWLTQDKNHKIMALDTLYAYRLPAPNMAPFSQIAAPVLENMPSVVEFELTLLEARKVDSNPRMRQTIDAILKYKTEILSDRERGVEVAHLPALFVNPEGFGESGEVMAAHNKVLADIKDSIKKIIGGAQ
ncbi:hypothetical protein L3V32_25980 [Vibrio sp. J2-4]|uniref:hypothetical protein n=1 Tax=Vibrio sp. J2-4 TaxID=1507977 RepID=UPI001F43A2BD|nr:hypothetical protein [Vibrio sp. J2-4]MCF7480110.1 hypothetical protein [Vibrio sp. J2-4]